MVPRSGRNKLPFGATLSPAGVRILPRPEEARVSSEFSAQQYAMMARLVPASQLAGYVIEEQIGAGGWPWSSALVTGCSDDWLR